MLQEELERFCMNMVENNAGNKKSYFSTLLAVYSSPKIGEYIKDVLSGEQVLQDVTISDNDKINIAFNIVLRDSNIYEGMREYIASTVKNKDLLNHFAYVLSLIHI